MMDVDDTIDGVDTPTTRLLRPSWSLAASIITEERIGWAISTLLPYKAPGPDGVIPRYLKDVVLMLSPLSDRQYAFRVGFSVEAALHGITRCFEEALSNRQYAVACFMDIEGAFNQTPKDVFIKGMLDHGVDAAVVRWIDKMLSDRVLTTEFGGITAGGLANRGCPQGGILSPMLWCLAVDSLLEKLRSNGFQVWGYADDIAVVVVHEDGRAAKRLINSALRLMEDWCSETNLSVNPTKTELLVVTRKKKRLDVRGIKLNGVQLTKSDQVKYLGVTFTSNLSWRVQVERTINRARKNLATISRMVGSTWGLTPAAAHWVYSCIILPRLFFGAVIWWEGVQNFKIGNKLESLQHVGLKRILGAFRYSPTRAMEAMLAMPPLLFRIEEVAIRTAKLLRDWGKWQSTDRGHSSVLLKCIP